MAFTITRPIEEHKQGFIAIINSDSFNKITLKYPLYLQLNIEREPDEVAKTSMYTYIDTIRGFANIAKANISSSISVSDMRIIYSNFLSSIS